MSEHEVEGRRSVHPSGAAGVDAERDEPDAEPAQPDAGLGELADDAGEPSRMTAAEARFAVRLAEDLEHVLGVGIAVADLEIEGEGPVRIRAALLAEGAVQDIEGTGENSLEAYRALIRAAAELRLTRAFWRTVGDM
jgi:hypothetical protein